MTQYNNLKSKLSNSQLNRLKSATKNKTEVILRLSSNMIGNSELQLFVKLLQISYQLISSHQKLNYLK